jgi:hypothetical protein
MHVRCLLVVLGMTLVAPSLVTPSSAAAALGARTAHDGGFAVLAQYITREEQQRRAQENLERHRQENSNSNSDSRVDKSTGAAIGETYGREYLERQIQGTDKPRVVRPY